MKRIEWMMIAFAAIMVCGGMLGGCATAEMDTMKVEFTLSAANSMCFHLADSIDQEVTDKIRVKSINGDNAAAAQDYADYKPKIEKARGVCNAADDTVQNADKERQAIPKGGDVKNFTAWLPALSSTYVLVSQAIADLKALVQK